MSFAVVRGSPSRAQLYLDEILKSASDKYKCKVSELNLSQVLFHCMQSAPAALCTIDAAAEKCFSNEEMLGRVVAAARGLTAKGAAGQNVVLMLDNHYHLMILYYALLFAGTIPFLSEPSSSAYELLHFLELLSPSHIFCDGERLDDVESALQEYSERHKGNQLPEIVVSDDETSLEKFFGPQSNDYKTFVPVNVSPDSPSLMLPTSGSTGLPKVTVLTHQALVVQLPNLWNYSEIIPQPFRLMLMISTEQWMTHTMLMTACPAYKVPVLMSRKRSPEEIVTVIEKYKPENLLCSPPYALTLANAATKEQLTSLKCIILAGSKTTPTMYDTIKDKLSVDAIISNAYGLTETSGCVAFPDKHVPPCSCGAILNLFEYKFLDDNGKEVGVNENGELHVRSKFCMFKNYHNNIKATEDCFTSDGWFKTGDVFSRDDEGLIYYVERKKFIFKYMNHQISPEEIEAVLCEVHGVLECAVSGSEMHGGAAAALVVIEPENRPTKEELHHAVNSKFMYYKRLHGGIAFVESLPHSINGKIDRKKCAKLLNDLIKSGECC